MFKRSIIATIPFAIPAGGYYIVNRHMTHHDAAFNQMMWELWANPNRDTETTDCYNDPRIKTVESYLDGGFFYIFLYEPPFDALDRFRGVPIEEYNQRCLGMARKRFDDLVNASKNK